MNGPICGINECMVPYWHGRPCLQAIVSLVYMVLIPIYGTGSEKMSYRYIYIKVIKMIHFKIATSPEP